jgi:hypothetical protein
VFAAPSTRCRTAGPHHPLSVSRAAKNCAARSLSPIHHGQNEQAIALTGRDFQGLGAPSPTTKGRVQRSLSPFNFGSRIRVRPLSESRHHLWGSGERSRA